MTTYTEYILDIFISLGVDTDLGGNILPHVDEPMILSSCIATGFMFI